MTKYKQQELIKSVFFKSKNVRIEVLFFKEQNDHHFFIIKTKRLNDFKKRIIAESTVKYSTHSFFVISELMQLFIKDDAISNKMLLNEINKFPKGEATVYSI